MAVDIQTLVQGYKQFRKKYFEDPSHTAFDELVRCGQRPKVLIIACSDSRVDPAIVTNSQPGDLFVVRNVANLVPPYEDDSTYHSTSAALEFGVCNLEVEHIIVFGHSQCGGIGALVEGSNNIINKKGFISKWIELARPAYETVNKHHFDSDINQKIVLCSKYSLINSFYNLYTFPWIEKRVKNGSLTLHAWYFDLSTGIIHSFEHKENRFIELK